MLEPIGFWSYARDDDRDSDGQLSQLRAIVGQAIALRYGGQVQLWQDIAAIPYGADWADEIERSIGQTTFLIPIITPRFVKSRHCYDEFLAFRRRMIALGRNDLIFPVRVLNIDNVRPEESAFGADIALLRRYQEIDFSDLLYSDLRSPEAKRHAGRLADSVLLALRRPGAAVSTAPKSPATEEAPVTVASFAKSAQESQAATEADAETEPESPAATTAQPRRPPPPAKQRTNQLPVALIMLALAVIVALGGGAYLLSHRAPAAVVTSAPTPMPTPFIPARAGDAIPAGFIVMYDRLGGLFWKVTECAPTGASAQVSFQIFNDYRASAIVDIAITNTSHLAASDWLAGRRHLAPGLSSVLTQTLSNYHCGGNIYAALRHVRFSSDRGPYVAL